MSRVFVVGSINMDIVNRVHQHPQPGETMHGFGTVYSPGGKGANQAIAATRTAGNVLMIASVGEDAFGQQLIDGLLALGVNVDQVSVKPTLSGLAFITVDEGGENTIILSSGANNEVNTIDVQAAFASIEDNGILLVQNEIPWKTTEFAIMEGHAAGLRVFWNPAPAMDIPRDILPFVDTIILNELEASVATGLEVHSIEDAKDAAQRLINDGGKSVVITLGEHGSVYVDSTTYIHTPAFRVNVVDTTAAGDTFIGAFAVASTENSSKEKALRFASAASALSVSRAGAQSSIPSREEVNVFLEAQTADSE